MRYHMLEVSSYKWSFSAYNDLMFVLVQCWALTVNYHRMYA